jgi:spore coat polysaccharide biosynthesis predicted glycosyltransferase SpsG
MTLKVALLSDPTFDSGLGHLSRLIAVGQELKERGESYCFHPLSRFTPRQVEFIAVNSLDTRCLCHGKPDISVVDTYNKDYHLDLDRSSAGQIIQLVDEFTPYGKCDGLIEVSPISPFRIYPEGLEVQKFQDSPLFRDEIYFLSAEIRPRSNGSNKWFLTLGGVTDSIYIEVLTLLHRVIGDSLRDFTIGTDSVSVINFARGLGVTRSSPTQDLTFICRNFDFVISAAGVTAWEFSVLKFPGFVISVIDNQEFQLAYLLSNGFRDGISLVDEKVELALEDCLQKAADCSSRVPMRNGRENAYLFFQKFLNS